MSYTLEEKALMVILGLLLSFLILSNYTQAQPSSFDLYKNIVDEKAISVTESKSEIFVTYNGYYNFSIEPFIEVCTPSCQNISIKSSLTTAKIALGSDFSFSAPTSKDGTTVKFAYNVSKIPSQLKRLILRYKGEYENWKVDYTDLRKIGLTVDEYYNEAIVTLKSDVTFLDPNITLFSRSNGHFGGVMVDEDTIAVIYNTSIVSGGGINLTSFNLETGARELTSIQVLSASENYPIINPTGYIPIIAFNSTLVGFAVNNDTSDDLEVKIYDINTGTKINSITINSVGKATGVDMEAYNSTDFLISWDNWSSADETYYEWYTIYGVERWTKTVTAIDYNSDNNHISILNSTSFAITSMHNNDAPDKIFVNVSTINGDKIALGYDGEATATSYYTDCTGYNTTIFACIFGAGDTDVYLYNHTNSYTQFTLNSSENYYNSIALINSTTFAIAYGQAGNTWLAFANVTGNILMHRNITGSKEKIQIIGKQRWTNIDACSDNFVIIHGNTTGVAISTFKETGEDGWNNCNSAPTIDSNTINDTTLTYGDGAKNTLTCTDADGGDTITYFCYLGVNGVNITAKALTGTITSGVATDIMSIGRVDYDGDDLINISCKCSDGTVMTSELNTSMATASKATPVVSTTLTTPITYETASDYSASETNLGDADCTYTLFRNGTSLGTGNVNDNTVLGFGTYNYTYYSAGGANYTSVTDAETLTVNKKSLTLSFTQPTGTISYGTSKIPNCAITQGGATLYRDGINKTTEENNIATTYGVASYNFDCNGSLPQFNYSYTNLTLSLTVTQATPTLTLTIDGSSTTPQIGSRIYPNSTTIASSETNTGDSDCTYTLVWNGSSITNGATIFPSRSHNITYYTTGCTNYTSSSTSRLFDVTKGATSSSLYLNTTSADKWFRNSSTINITAKVNVSALYVNISSNLTGWVRQTGATSISNISLWSSPQDTVYNVTAHYDGNENYTSSSTTYYIKQDVTLPTLISYVLNDTYININQSIQIRANVSDDFSGISNVIARLNTSHSIINVTLTQDATGNYTYNLTKANLGDTALNATNVHILNIYTNDTANNYLTNTTDLIFNYARTYIYAENYPTETYNGASDYISFTAYYNDTENNYITSNCTVSINADTYQLNWVGANYKHYVSQLVSGWTDTTYTYTINCINNGYQSQQAIGTFIVRSGTGGSSSPPSGGGGGGSVGIATTSTPTTVPVTSGIQTESLTLGKVAKAEIGFIGVTIAIILYIYSTEKKKKLKGGTRFVM